MRLWIIPSLIWNFYVFFVFKWSCLPFLFPVIAFRYLISNYLVSDFSSLASLVKLKMQTVI